MRSCTQIHPQSHSSTILKWNIGILQHILQSSLRISQCNGVKSMTFDNLWSNWPPTPHSPRMLMWVGLEHKRALKMAREQEHYKTIFLFRSCLKAIYTSCQNASDSHTFKSLYNMARQILCAKKLGKKEIIGSGICWIHIYSVLLHVLYQFLK